jgi:hypothetical protein
MILALCGLFALFFYIFYSICEPNVTVAEAINSAANIASLVISSIFELVYR